MSMFGTQQREQYDALYNTLSNPADTSALEREQAPGFLEGDLLGSTGTGVYRGISRGAATLGNVATPALRPIAKSIDEVFGTSTDDWLLGEQEKANRSLVESKIDPKTTGMAGQLLYGLGDVLTTVASTGGNPYAAGGLYGITQTQLGMAEGLDTTTAVAKGTLEGLGLGVGVALAPAYGSTLLQKLLSGSALNVGVGVATRAPVSVLLNARGYPEMARQYEPFDAASIITDAVLGAAFGGIYRQPAKGAPAIAPDAVPPSTVDAALVANQQAHAEIHTAPGVPTDTISRQQHTAGLDTAITQLALGRDVSVEAVLRDAGFTGKRPDFDALRIIADEMEKAGATDVVAKLREIESEARMRGLYVEPDSLGTVVRSDAPAEVTVRGVADRDGTPVRIGQDTVPSRLVLMEAGEVAATMNKADNQFRDRTRMASEQQINEIAAKLDAHLLMDSPVMDFGAPVLAGDGTVIGGNGRAAAIGRAYEIGTAGGYRDTLRATFGDAVDGMQRPMMVRVLQRDVDVRKAAILSNEGGGLRMSALEQAKVDAERLGDFRAFEFSEDGSLDLVGNMPFIRAWAEQTPQNQRAAIMDADGRLSAEGAGRLRNAILFRAYGDSPTLARLVEATDPGSRNIAAALTRAAPAVADAREAIARGDLYPMGIHDDLVSAVEKLESIRRQGMAVSDWTKQIDAFGDGMTAEARLLVQFLDANIRATRQISDGIFGFYNRLMEAGNPKQGSMFEASQPDKTRMLTLALEQPSPMYSRATVNSPLVKFLLDVTSSDEAFRYQRSKATDIEAVFRDVAPDFKLQPILNKDDARPRSTGYYVFPPGGGKGKVYLFNDGTIQTDVSQFVSGSSGGSAVYAALSEFAANTGRRFEGDSAGISLAGILRRTENMLSAMLKRRSSDHLVPHAAQVDPSKHPNPAVRRALREAGFTGVKWSTGDFAHNVAEIATQSYNVITKVLPEIRDVIVTEFGDFQRVSDGEILGTTDLQRLAEQASQRLAAIGKTSGAGEAPRVGSATVARAAFVNTVARAEGVAGGDGLLAAVGKELRTSGLGAVKGSFYSRAATVGAKADDLTAAFRAQFGRDADRLLDAGRVRVVQSVRDLPGGPHPDDVGGMFWQGESWVVADNTGLSAIRGRVLHEIGVHAGMRDMLGEALYADTLARVEAKVGTDPVFQEARALAEQRANKPEHVPEETLAYLVENAPELPMIRRLLAQVRQWLYRTTGGRFVDLTQADLQMMAVASLRRAARADEIAAKGGDAPWYMTFFHGTPNPFKPEGDAPLGRLRWKYINTGEGAQAFGYGHYVAQQEWIARTRYRDRLVKRKGASIELEGPNGKFTITENDDPAWKVGDRIVHARMGGDAMALADAAAQVARHGYDRARTTFEAIARNSRETGERMITEKEETIRMLESQLPDEATLTKDWERKAVAKDRETIEKIRSLASDLRAEIEMDQARLRALDEVTVEIGGPMFRENTDGTVSLITAEGDLYKPFKSRSEAQDFLDTVVPDAEKMPARVLRPDITEVKPEPPKGALYGKHIPDEEYARMMIWDAPLSAQPENVRAAFEKLLAAFRSEMPNLYDRFRGVDAYRKLVSLVEEEDGSGPLADLAMTADMEARMRRAPDGTDPVDFDLQYNSEEQASIILSLLGVPGHRFLDGETRAAGWKSPEAKFNLVLYSDDLGRVAWEAKEGDTEWVTANGRGLVRMVTDPDTGAQMFETEVDGVSAGLAETVEEATRAVEQELDSFYSRTGDDTIKPTDPIEDTTMPGARALADQADAEIAQAKELSQGFMPAVECFLQVGQ